MSEAKVVAKRRGGRQARRELRAAPIPAEERAVQPGMMGGLYQPLSEHDKGRINQAALDMLERIGLVDAIPSCVELVTAAGGTLNGDGRLLFPRALVEDILAKAARRFILHAFDPERDLEPSGKKVYFGTGGAAVHMVDAATGVYRESTLADLYDIARLVDKMDHIHFFQRPIVLRDMTEPRELDLNTCYAAVAGTTKHVGTSFFQPEHLD